MEQPVVSNGLPTLSFGSFSLTGRKRDLTETIAISHRLLLDEEEEKELMVLNFFGIYDADESLIVADVYKAKLHLLVAKEVRRWFLKYGNDRINWSKVLQNSFINMDVEIDDSGVKIPKIPRAVESIEPTALVALVTMNQIIVTNCSNSKAVLCRGGEVLPLSNDHKPHKPDDRKRILASAGENVFYLHQNRMLRVIATKQINRARKFTRDQHLKPCVISIPEVSIIERSENDHFIILASDGLWSVIQIETACDIVRDVLNGRFERMFPSFLEENAVNNAAILLTELAMSRGSNDNISVVVIELNKAI